MPREAFPRKPRSRRRCSLSFVGKKLQSEGESRNHPDEEQGDSCGFALSLVQVRANKQGNTGAEGGASHREQSDFG